LVALTSCLTSSSGFSFTVSSIRSAIIRFLSFLASLFFVFSASSNGVCFVYTCG
jgi:hypothetical protein